MLVVLAGFCVREDLLGVTSIVRALGLEAMCYDRILDFLHTPALNPDTLARVWTRLVLRAHPGVLRCRGMAVLVADGLKNPKAGKKMPGVKKLHQSGSSNTKPPFIPVVVRALPAKPSPCWFRASRAAWRRSRSSPVSTKDSSSQTAMAERSWTR
jgi:hypothetical protein